MISQSNISSKMENVLSISHLKEYKEEYSFLRSISMFLFIVNLSDMMSHLLLVSITDNECVLSKI